MNSFWGPSTYQNVQYVQGLRVAGTVGFLIGMGATDLVTIDPSGLGVSLSPGIAGSGNAALLNAAAGFTGYFHRWQLNGVDYHFATPTGLCAAFATDDAVVLGAHVNNADGGCVTGINRALNALRSIEVRGSAVRLTSTSGNDLSLISAANVVVSGPLSADNKFTKYNNITTAGLGVSPIVASGRATGQAGTVANICSYVVGGADGDFQVSGNVNVTTSTTFSFSLDCTYTDETGAARTFVTSVCRNGGAVVNLMTNGLGSGPYAGLVATIRAQAGSTITMRTSAGGTYTAVVYNVDASIKQVA